jgi:hypothetical protein
MSFTICPSLVLDRSSVRFARSLLALQNNTRPRKGSLRNSRMIIRYVQLERYDWGTKIVMARIQLALAFYFTGGATALGLHIPVIDVVSAQFWAIFWVI